MIAVILPAGLVAGALDITYACIIWAPLGVTPVQIGQSISAGLLGREAAVDGGAWTAALGWVLHFLMALAMAAAYYFAALRLPLLVRQAIPCGVVYGLGLYIVMNYVVIPLSAIGGSGGGNTPLYIAITGVLVHMFLVGLPIALFTRKALRGK
jgi:hypothetical protein